MESPSNYSSAAWHVLGLLLSRGRPTPPSELAYSLRSTSDFVRLLCSIPNSPLLLAQDDVVTFSQVAVAALVQFFANSDLITRCSDSPHYVPRLLLNVRSNYPVRTYCRKRKSEHQHFLTEKRKRLFLDLDEEKKSNQITITIPFKFQNVVTQCIEALSSLPSHSALDCCKCKTDAYKPVMCRKLEYNTEIENTEHAAAEIRDIKRFSCSDRMHNQSCSLNLGRRTPYIHQVTAEELSISVPAPKLAQPLTSNLADGGEIGDDGIVHPVYSKTIFASSKLEIDEQMIVTHEKSHAVTHGCDSLTGSVVGKIEEVFVDDSGSCEGHKEYQPMDRIHKIKHDSNNPEKSLTKSPPDHKHEAYNRKRAVFPTKENCKLISGKSQEPCKRDKHPISVRQTEKIDCNQIIDTQEKKDTSIEKRENPSSISNNIEQPSFPEFESYLVEQEEGSGGYGTVYRARRKTDGVIFAIKCPHVNANKHNVNNEIKMLERLGGKNFVIKYEGSFQSGSADCLVLQHVQHDRPEILKREMKVSDLQWYGYCLFKALAGLHRQEIVHRDVKPGNFLYSCKLNKGYLIDFNLASDMRKKYGIVDNFKVRPSLNDPTAIYQTKSTAKISKLMDTTCINTVNKNAGKVSRSLLPPGNLKRKVDKAKVINEASSRNIIKSQGADGSGITSAKDATSTITVSMERLREPLPSHGRKELLSLAQEAMQGGNHESVDAPKSKRKRVSAPAGDAGSKFLYVTPMPLHGNGSAGSYKSKGNGKPAKEGTCAGTKGFKAPEVLFRSLHQGPKADIWSAGVTLLYLMIGRTPFAGDTEQNIKEIAKLRGSEDLWEVAKLHNHESAFPMELLDVQYLSPVNLRDWCARHARRKDFLDAMPRSLFDLVDKCLMVNPRLRISADEALRHEFFAPCNEALRKQRLMRQGSQK